MDWDKVDKECVEMCKSINLLEGIQTTESCCGHGKDNFRIWFMAENLESLPPLLYWLHGCHSGFYGWSVTAKTDCVMSPVSFMIEGPMGEIAYNEAKEIARLISEYVMEEEARREEEPEECQDTA